MCTMEFNSVLTARRRERLFKGGSAFPKLCLLLLVFACGYAPTSAQEAGAQPPPRESVRIVPPGGGGRADLYRRLNLQPEQARQIADIREQTRAEWREATQQLRRAQRALDDAIYSEAAEESVIEERARAVATAQAAVVRLRALIELRIRRVLTAQQLSALRNLREQARRTNPRQLRRMREAQNAERSEDISDTPAAGGFPETRRNAVGSGRDVRTGDGGGPALRPREPRQGPLRRFPRP